MKEYVTLDELKQQMNVDSDTDNEYIKGLVLPVQLQIETYLNRPLEELEREGRIDARIWHAIRILVATHYANREDLTYGQPQSLHLVESLLQPLKKYT